MYLRVPVIALLALLLLHAEQSPTQLLDQSKADLQSGHYAEAIDNAVESIRWRIGSEKDDARLTQWLEAFMVGASSTNKRVCDILIYAQHALE